MLIEGKYKVFELITFKDWFLSVCWGVESFVDVIYDIIMVGVGVT